MSVAFLIQNLSHVSDSVGYDCIFQYRVLKDALGDAEDIRIFADVFSKDLHPDVEIYKMEDFWPYIEKNPHSHIIYHFCDGWDGVDEFLCREARNAIVRWHNNTPPWFYVNGNIEFASGCNRGFRTIARMASSSSVRFMVNSEFTRRQLHALDGLDSHIDTVFPGSSFLLKERTAVKASFAPAGAPDTIGLLFVGRVVPHKGHRHILSVAAAVQRFSGKRVRVSFVGALEPRLEDYRSELSDAAIRLGVEVIFTGVVSDLELSELYQACDAFICMSEHEGFGMPVFEAMRSHVPIVAWASSAMSDLLEGHPFASSEFDIHRFAACVMASLNSGIRQRVVAFQETILQQYTRESVSHQLLNALAHARGESVPTKPAIIKSDDERLNDIIAFVSSLAEWMEQEIGKSIETFEHDASVNYVGLYDIAVHERLIEFIRGSATQIAYSATLSDSGDIVDLHPGHAVIRKVMTSDHPPSIEPAQHLQELLSYDDDVFVQIAFATFLGRAADEGAIRSYLRRLRSGEDKLSIIRELTGSQEAQRHNYSLRGLEDIDEQPFTSLLRVETAVARLGRYLVPGSGGLPPYHPMGSIHHVDDLLRLNDVAFVDTCYHILLGRAADPGGLEYYTGSMRDGMSRREVLANLAGTPEGAARVGHLDGLSEFLAEQSLQDEIPLPNRLAKLENELGRMTNWLVAGVARTAKEESGHTILRLSSKALEDNQSRLSVEAVRHCEALERSAYQSDGFHTQPSPGETRFDYIHQILITADGMIPETMPDMVRHNVDSIRRYHPEAQYRLWSGDDLRIMIARNFDREVLHAFDTLQAFALKADLARYCLLYVYGGLYSDLSNRFLARWRIKSDKAIACFREHKPLHGAVWMNQNTIIYAQPYQPEIRLAIDLVLENVRNREYGISSLAPTGPVLFGRVVAVIGRADCYHIGESVNMQVEGGLNRSCYVDGNGSLIAARLQGGGGRPAEIGLRGTNVYGEMWDKRKIYGEGLMFFAHDYPDFLTTARRDEHGIHITAGDNATLEFAMPALPRGLYLATWRFGDVQKGTLDATVQVSLKANDPIFCTGLVANVSGHVRVVVPLESSANLELRIQGRNGFEGVFKDFTIERLSPDPSEQKAIPSFSQDIVPDIAPKGGLGKGIRIHHIAYDEELEAAEAAYIGENIRIARELHAGCEQLVWTQASLREMIATQFSADVVLTFDRLRTARNRSELGRYCLLYVWGGLYVDPWVRMVNAIDIPQDKDIACFRSVHVELGASWAVDTAVLYARAGQPEFAQLIEQIVESVRTEALGTMPSSVTGSERLGRLLAVTYDAKRYFGGEVIPVTRGKSVRSDGLLSQDGRLVAVRSGPESPLERERRAMAQAWTAGEIYGGSALV